MVPTMSISCSGCVLRRIAAHTGMYLDKQVHKQTRPLLNAGIDMCDHPSKSFQFIQTWKIRGKKISEHDHNGSRTHNLRFQRSTPRPRGHTDTTMYPPRWIGKHVRLDHLVRNLLSADTNASRWGQVSHRVCLHFTTWPLGGARRHDTRYGCTSRTASLPCLAEPCVKPSATKVRGGLRCI